jgi:hypothetical protein
MFLIDDELHAERQLGQFDSLEDALNELRRRASIPWNEAPNLAPCQSWKTCGRHYEVIEYDASVQPWKELRRVLVLRVSAKGVEWLSAQGPAA